MEEILASIRRIIADDDGAKPKAAEPTRPPIVEPPPPPPAPPPPPQNVMPVPSPVAMPPEPDPAEDVLDLTPAMEVTDNAPAGFQTINPSQDLVFEEPPPPAPEPPPAVEAPVQMEPPSTVEVARRNFEHTTGDERSMLAQSTVHAVDAAFNSLAQSVLVQNSQTLDGLVREMLRPMLKAWLDENLPAIVERLVRAEIERVARGAR